MSENTTVQDSHDSTVYHPNEVTTVPIDQTYNADNASTSNNTNDAVSEVQADSRAEGASYGDNIYAPDLSAGGVSLVLSPSVSKLGTAQGGMTTSAANKPVIYGLLAAGAAVLVLYSLWKRRRVYGY